MKGCLTKEDRERVLYSLKETDVSDNVTKLGYGIIEQRDYIKCQYYNSYKYTK